jgi:hypothetical protein
MMAGSKKGHGLPVEEEAVARERRVTTNSL